MLRQFDLENTTIDHLPTSAGRDLTDVFDFSLFTGLLSVTTRLLKRK